jgi:hypothetical protein
MRDDYDVCNEYVISFLINSKGEFKRKFLNRKVICACGSLVILANYYNHTLSNRHLEFLLRNQQSEKFEIIDIGKYKIKKII